MGTSAELDRSFTLIGMKRTPAETVAVAAVTFAVHFVVVPIVMGYFAARGMLLKIRGS